jgi:hypothetical protein
MFGQYVLDDDGRPLPCPDVAAWAAWAFEPDALRRRRVAYTYIRKSVSVSTVFLGFDHAFSFEPETPPVLWETMIFGGPHDRYQERYTSREDALAGHACAVMMARSKPRKVRASRGWRRHVRRTKAG